MHARVSPRRRPNSGFSLPEVAMAIGIIAIAFVALIALIPAGLNQLRTAMDSNNDTRIVQSMVSLALATEYSKLSELEPPTYYFDDEGSPLDNSAHEEEDSKASRLYAAKVFIQPAKIESPNLEYSTSSRMIIVYGSLYDPETSKLQDLTYQTLRSTVSHPAPGKKPLRMRSVTIAKTDGR